MSIDTRNIARNLVEQITDTVLKRFNQRARKLIPPRLTGRCFVTDMKAGEAVMDAVDDLIEAAYDDWPDAVDNEVFLDLIQVDDGWAVEWVVDSTPSGAGGDEEAS